jgi:hypothetical protein
MGPPAAQDGPLRFQVRGLFWPLVFYQFSCLRYHKAMILLGLYGGDDGARTRDLCRDSREETRNLLESGGTDGSFQLPEEPVVTRIVSL